MKILIAGTGAMALEYAKVIGKGLCLPFSILGRKEEKITPFHSLPGFAGGMLFSRLENLSGFTAAIAATSIESLFEVSKKLLENGASGLLVEKPVSVQPKYIEELDALAKDGKALIRVACNRRYYNSILKLKSILKTESTLCAHFDFTEWLSRVPLAWQSAESGRRLALSNSIHVFDTLVYLLGDYLSEKRSVRGKNLIPWHPDGAVFSGLGFCGSVPVTHCTSWISPGRWNLEVMTEKGRYRLSPMESLQVMRHESVHWEELPHPDEDDMNYKPGLLKMTRQFLEQLNSPAKEVSSLPTLEEYLATANTLSGLVGYDS